MRDIHDLTVNNGVWNIHGLTVKVNNDRLNKFDDLDFQKMLDNFEILCLQETQCGPTNTQILSVPGQGRIQKKN